MIKQNVLDVLNLCKSYGNHLVLDDISFSIRENEIVGFIGPNGAGKSTLMKMLLGVFKPERGSIRLYEENGKYLEASPDTRCLFSYVPQGNTMFSGTIADNMRNVKPDATDEECITAAKLANADGFIRMLPQGYDTVLKGDGSGLSQGQRQLISIARAAVEDPPVMILDEATSSIDTHTEAIVQAGMDALMAGRTVFVIAHRLSTVRNADAIMVLDHGRIIERGTHDQLIAQHGTYYQLYTGALELE